MPCFGGCAPRVVGSPSAVSARRLRHLGPFHSLSASAAGQGVPPVVPLCRVDEAVRCHAAVLAEAAVPLCLAGPVFTQLRLTTEPSKVVDFDGGAPPAPLPATRAIALAGAHLHQSSVASNWTRPH